MNQIPRELCESCHNLYKNDYGSDFWSGIIRDLNNPLMVENFQNIIRSDLIDLLVFSKFQIQLKFDLIFYLHIENLRNSGRNNKYMSCIEDIMVKDSEEILTLFSKIKYVY